LHANGVGVAATHSQNRAKKKGGERLAPIAFHAGKER